MATKKAAPAGPVFHNNFAMEQITVSPELQARAAMNQDAIGDYKDAIFEGTELPPMELVHDGETYWLVDGFHRYHAYKKLSIMSVPVNVTKGTKEDAILKAVAANSTHGLRRTNADKRKATRMVFDLMNAKSENWTDQRIADLTGVSAMFVGNVRKEEFSETYAKTRTGGSRTITIATPPAVPVVKKTPVPATPKEKDAPTEPKDVKFPLGVALDKLRNRLQSTEAALSEVFKLFPSDALLQEAIEANTEQTALWQSLRDSSAAIAKAINELGGDKA